MDKLIQLTPLEVKATDSAHDQSKMRELPTRPKMLKNRLLNKKRIRKILKN